MTVVKFSCSVESELVKKFEFEGMRGSPKLILQTFEDLKKRIKGGISLNYAEKNGKVTVEKRILALSKKNKGRDSIIRPEYQPLNLGCSTEVNLNEEKETDMQGTKIVEINRMLASNQYGVGKQLEEFKITFIKNLEEDADFKNPAKYVSLSNIV